jgi:hypothetical protein
MTRGLQRASNQTGVLTAWQQPRASKAEFPSLHTLPRAASTPLRPPRPLKALWQRRAYKDKEGWRAGGEEGGRGKGQLKGGAWQFV